MRGQLFHGKKVFPAPLKNRCLDNFNNYETSIYISSLTNDVKYIEENYIFSIFPIITQVTLFLTTLVVMLVYSPILTLVSILFAILPLVASLIVGGKLSYYEEKISEENGSFKSRNELLNVNKLGKKTFEQ